MHVWILTSVIAGDDPESDVFATADEAYVEQLRRFSRSRSAEPDQIRAANDALDKADFELLENIIAASMEEAECNEYLFVNMYDLDGPSAGSISVFTDEELATVLHGLRLFQENLEPTIEGCSADGDDCGHFEEVAHLNSAQIDQLCERLNLPAKLRAA
jgi:hypothetical protein